MLHPAGLRINLGEFLLDLPYNLPFVVIQDGRGSGRPLVNRKDIHICLPSVIKFA